LRADPEGRSEIAVSWLFSDRLDIHLRLRLIVHRDSKGVRSLHRCVDSLHEALREPFLGLNSDRTPMSYLGRTRSRDAWWIAVLWLAVGLITATQVVVGMAAVGMRLNWIALFFTTVAAWLILPIATPVVLSLSRRFPLAKAGDWRNLPVHLAAALGFGIGHIVWSATVEWIFNPLALQPHASFHGVFFTTVYMQFHTGLIIYAATLAIGNTMDSIRRLAYREAESARLAGELSKAQVEALRRQLEPHFLFNTMNAISGLVREKRNDAAVEMIAGLSDLLRRVLEDAGRELVPLAEEVAFLESYIKLQAMRFGDRLKVTVDVPLELYGALVPPLVLQPLVENAIVHGIEKLVDGGEIRVTARESEGMLSIYLYNDGPALSLARSYRTGVGLSNTRGRLLTLYGAGSSVVLRRGFQAGVEAIIKFPYRTAA
jgi:two-component system LytT family sensor kinase